MFFAFHYFLLYLFCPVILSQVHHLKRRKLRRSSGWTGEWTDDVSTCICIVNGNNNAYVRKDDTASSEIERLLKGQGGAHLELD